MTLLTKIRRPNTPSIFSDLFDGDSFFSPTFPALSNLGIAAKVPATNISETDKEFMLELAAPGMEKNDFHVDVENGCLVISSEKEESSDITDENYTRREFSYSSFKRSFTLPETVKMDKIDATYKNGILHVSIPKKEEAIKQSMKKEIKVH